METVVWAPGDDFDEARRVVQANPLSRDARWLGDIDDNCSDAPVAQIFASPRNLRLALRALVAARAVGKTTQFTLIEQAGENDLDVERQSLVAACNAVAGGTASSLAAPVAPSGPILFDLTTSVMSSGPPTGMARLEGDLYRALVEVAGNRVAPIAWNRQSGNFVQLPRDAKPEPIAPDELTAMETDGRARPLARNSVAPGSQIVTTGGTWTRRPQFLDALGRVRSQCAAQLTVLIHDLAQIKLQDLYTETAPAFERNARRLIAIADRFLVYSEATRTDLRELLVGADLPFKPIGRFVVGSTLTVRPAPADSISIPAGLESVAGKRFALYVSSIEPRKNHRMLAQVWRRLVERYGDQAPMLLCVGRPVMDGKDLIDEISNDAVLGPHVQFATGLTDEDLDWCYRHAALTLYPSLYEGWGLPIAESLLYGKVCIVSDVSSMREVSPELTDRVDPTDAEAWTERVSFYFENPGELAARENLIRTTYQPRSWLAAAREVVDALAHPTSMVPAVHIQPLSILTARAGDEDGRIDRILTEGWEPSTKNGAATSMAQSTIAFTYLGAPRFALRLRFAAQREFGEPQLEVEGGAVDRTFHRSSNTLDLVISRPVPFGEIELQLRAQPGTTLVQVEVADTLAAPTPRANSLLQLGRRILARLTR